MNVTLRQLQVFRAVSHERNFSRAGDGLGLTQPAVSRSIRELEAQLGVKLLDRTTREVMLTEAGQVLALRLETVLEELDQMLQDVGGLARARRGKVRVACIPTLSANLMPACIAACGKREPGIQMVLLDRNQQEVLNSVRSGEVDFGLVIDPSESGDLHAEAIMHDPFVLVTPKAHPLAKARSVRWQALSGRALVLLDQASGSRRLIDAALARQGARCEVAQEVGHATAVYRMIEAGIGVSVMPSFALPPGGVRSLAVRPLSPKVERAVVLVHRRNRAPSPLAQRVWAVIRDVAAKAEPGRA